MRHVAQGDVLARLLVCRGVATVVHGTREAFEVDPGLPRLIRAAEIPAVLTRLALTTQRLHWLGWEDSNLRMAESKSNYFA